MNFSQGATNTTSDLISTLIFWVIVGIITILFRVFVSIYADKMAHTEFNRSVFSFFTHTLNLAMRFHMDASSGQLVKKITRGTDGIFQNQLNFFRRVMPSLFTIIILIPAVLYFNWKLWALVIGMGAISMIITFFLATYTFRRQEEVEHIYSDMSALYGDTFSNMSIIKSFTLFPLKQKQLQKLADTRIEKQYPILVWWGIIVSISQVLKIIVSITVIFLWSYLFLQGEISIGEIVMFLSFSTILLSAVEDLMWSLEEMFWRLAGIKEYFEIMDRAIEVQDKKTARILSKPKWKIEFQNVHFSYDGKRQVLTDINIDIKPGEKVAFVWHTGSGKTTMTNMLLRFFEPQKWDIKIDGISIYDVTQDSLRKNIWVVFQDNSLFNATIEENIRLDKEDASRDEIEAVAQKSHAIDFIKNLSDGLDTVVGERGVKLSGWEKQRLAIARAFLKDAPILILDEATSALDAETEKYLQWSFDELMKWRTTFIIAHRLSTIMKADRIFVFDAGKIVESGTYKELVEQKGDFAKLVAAQVEGFIE